MKKNLFILAVAAFALASCSNDDTVAENVSFNESNAISFRTSVNGVTRAVDQDASTLQTNGFYVTAIQNPVSGTASTYFDNVLFSYNAGTYNSETKYYWPSDGTLDFFAYAPNNAQAERTDYKTFTVTPASAAVSQVDFLYANTDGKRKSDSYSGGTYGSVGVPLNFRHTESKIIINLKNSNPNLTFTVGNVVIGNIKGSGIFTYDDNNKNTDTQNGNLTTAEWDVSSASNTTYTQTVSDATAYSSATAAQAGVDMILIPQELTTATTYSASTQNADFSGAYITVQIKIQNTVNASDGGYIVGDANNFVTAMWPIATPATPNTWVPGYKYTYEIDLAGGGYYPGNQDDADEDLDPILENTVIKFVNVTVDAWDAENGTVYTTNLPAPLP